MTANEFKEKVLIHYRTMWAVAMTRLRSDEDARDAVQEAVMRMWMHADELDTIGNLQAYCTTIVKRIAIDRLRELATHTHSSLDTLPDIDIPSTAANMTIETREAVAELSQCIRALPSGQARVIILYAYRGCDVDEICRITGYSPQNVRQLISRARKTIKQKLNI